MKNTATKINDSCLKCFHTLETTTDAVGLIRINSFLLRRRMVVLHGVMGVHRVYCKEFQQFTMHSVWFPVARKLR